MDIISFVILHYKDEKTTDRCVRSVLQMEQQERIRIVIVDNDIQEPLEERQNRWQRYQDNPAVTVLQVQENGGFSHANNMGYAYAREEQQAAFVVVANNDIEFPQTDFVRILEERYEKMPCHVLGPDVVRRSTGEHQNPMDSRIRTREEADYTIRMNRMALKFYGLLYPLLYWNNRRTEKKKLRENREKQEYYEKTHTDIVPFGACLIFTPAFVCREEKAFTPETKFYYEEYILSCRCRRMGYQILYDPRLKVYHESGTATKKSFGSERKRLRFVMERTAEACEVYREWLGKAEDIDME